MENDAIVVSGVSAVTAVGHNAPVSYGAVKAGLARIGTSTDLTIRDTHGKRMPPTCAAVIGVTDGHRRYLRHYRLAVRAFAEVLAHGGLQNAHVANTAVYLCLAEEERPGFDERVAAELPDHIARSLELADLAARTTIIKSGHAGIYEAAQQAALGLASGQFQRAIIGAVDSYLDELTLEWLQDMGRLKTDDNTKGFIPGEAAAFLVLENASSVQERGGRLLARLTGLGSASEAATIYDDKPSTGRGLAQALQTALRGQHTPVALVVCDLNGERYRANEWGYAMPRAFANTGTPAMLWHPADCVGDSGSAAGALNLVFGALALARRDAPAGCVLAWGSSDDQQRGAARLEALPVAGP